MIYVDNAATTKLSEKALDAMMPYLTEECGNPSSVHVAGQKAAAVIQRAREEIAEVLNCSPKEIYFTSGGSEADNQAIISAARIGARTGKKHILSTAFEHHAVLETLASLRDEGFVIELLTPLENDNITASQVENAIRPDTCLVTAMYANNEIGSILPIAEIGEVCRKKGVLFHTDAVQAVGHIKVDVKKDNIDMLSLSAHKFHGPKGIGVLYVKSGIELKSIILGGAQERGKRAGTENVPAIVGMAAALKESAGAMDENAANVRELSEKLIAGLSKIPGSFLNGATQNRLPGIVSLCFEGISGEELVLLLSERGICASSGSACSAGSFKPSHVMLAIGRAAELAKGALRLSLDSVNTEDEVDILLKEIPPLVDLLRKM
ncbi:MAG: cysteine desulfurase [Firmicutes bacterium]|nr:cysteine desulfurase [Bacillota bacterium]